MKTENIIWGLILVFVGGVLLLDNFDVIDFYWRTVWRFWPLFLIIIGANIIFSGKHSQAGSFISIAIVVAALAFIAYYGTRPQPAGRGWWPNVNIDIKSKDKNKAFNTQASFSEPFESRIQFAELNIAGGATVYKLEDTTANLFDAEVDQSWGKYSLQKVSKDSLEILNFRMKDQNKNWNFDSDKGNEVRFRLNKKPIWDIHVQTGAGETNFDLTPFKVKKLQFKGGAASFEVKLGEPVAQTDVIAETGVAEIKISVPAAVGCKIKVESGLSSKDFEGFTQQADGTYITSNYNSSTKKINISLKGGLSDFEVSRY